MKGIILKDLYENFRIFKNGVSYLAAVLFLFLLIEAMQTGDLFSLKYFFMLITAFVFPLLGCSSIESSLEQDEKVNFDKIQLTFPITKTEIVLSKYILGICFLTICNVFSLIFVFSFTSSHNKITLQEGLSAWGFGVLFSLVFFAVVNFAFFLLGRKLGLIVYIFIAMLFGGIYGAVSSLKGMEFLMAGDKTMIFIIGIPIGILFVVISFFLSLACYKNGVFIKEASFPGIRHLSISSSFVFPIMRFKISTSVCFIPARPTYPTALIVSSGQSITRPSPLANVSPRIAIL